MGNLSIEKCKFRKDKNFNGSLFDSLARQYLWHIGEDYPHGTGHGLGFFLNVHEGPHGISSIQSKVKFQEGMLVTNEPGFYLKNKFGIRIENNLLVKTYKNDENLLCFENLTMVPYENKLFERTLMSQEILDHINNYHKNIRKNLEPLLGNDENDKIALEYLIEKTKVI